MRFVTGEPAVDEFLLSVGSIHAFEQFRPVLRELMVCEETSIPNIAPYELAGRILMERGLPVTEDTKFMVGVALLDYSYFMEVAANS